MKRTIIAVIWTIVSVLLIAMGIGNLITSSQQTNGVVWGFIFIIILGIISGIAEVLVLVVFWKKIQASGAKRAEKRKAEKAAPEREITTVDVLGMRAGEETRILATYNFTVYSLMITYADGEREVVECQSDSSIFKKLLPYINVNKSELSE